MFCLCLPFISLADATANQFDIWEYQVEGNSLLQNSEIESALYPYLGAGRDLQVIESARDRLQVLYKQKGFPIVVVSIPQQNVVGGTVKLQVTEGRIDRVKITGNEYFSRRDIREELPSLAAGYPLNMERVRAEVDEANRLNPYRSLLPVIRPGRYPGTMELELKVRDRLPLHGNVETNNRYSASTSHARLSLSLGYDNLWQASHSLSLGYQMSPEVPDEVSVINMNYAMPTGVDSRLAFYAVQSDSNVATVTAEGDALTVLGNGRISGFRSIHPMRAGASYFHSVIVGADAKNFGEEQRLASDENTNGLNVPISYINWSLGYNASLRGSTDTHFSITGNFGIRGVGNDDEEFDFKRWLAKSSYFYLQAGFGQQYALTHDWQLNYNFRGQYTETLLISNEQFSAGGVDSVRGYLASSALGDNGIQASVGLNYSLFGDKPPAHVQQWTVGVFVDAARLRILEALPDPTADASHRTKLLSAGAGMGMQLFRDMNLKLDYAKPLYDLADDGFDDGAKLHFSLGYEF
ncbi:MAG: ShlB/FhaC/HecB family hemolysin secretion/activation protein [Gammaproteobacteria bacterium]|nr:ShlB/FhaC/HecB family hemolysin secretion/activation protein [Gammaproteobacteria bacterium]